MQEKKKQYLDLLLEEPYKIGHWVGFTDLTAMHNDWLVEMLYGERDTTIQSHRGSYKTTVLTLFLSLLIILMPNKNALFLRKTDTDIIEVVTQVGKILESPIIQSIVKILYGVDLKLITASKSEIHTNLCTTIKGQSQLLGLGSKASITGKHADIVVTDDIVNIRDRISRAEREQTKLIYMELQNIKNRDGRIINTGTPWHKEDAFSIMPNIQKHDCYKTDLISRDKLEELRQSMSDSLFAANYELKHIADTEAMFKSPMFTKEVESIYDGVCHVDASYGGRDGTSFTIMKDNGNEIIGLGKRWNRHVDDCISEICTHIQRFRAGTLHLERNADKGYLLEKFSNQGVLCQGYHESMNKHIKISTYLRNDWKRIKWLEDTDPEYINEVLDYNEYSAHDDSPDSAASLLREIKNEVKLTTYKEGI